MTLQKSLKVIEKLRRIQNTTTTTTTTTTNNNNDNNNNNITLILMKEVLQCHMSYRLFTPHQ